MKKKNNVCQCLHVLYYSRLTTLLGEELVCIDIVRVKRF